MDKIEQLEGRLKELAREKKTYARHLENKHRKAFERRATYVGNEIYSIAGLHSTDTRELMLMFVLQQEGVKVNDKNDQTDSSDDE